MKLDFIAIRAITLFAATMTLFGAAQGQQVAYPAKAVHIVVPFPPGAPSIPLLV